MIYHLVLRYPDKQNIKKITVITGIKLFIHLKNYGNYNVQGTRSSAENIKINKTKPLP